MNTEQNKNKDNSNLDPKGIFDIIKSVVDDMNDPEKGSDVSDYYNKKGSGGYTGD